MESLGTENPQKSTTYRTQKKTSNHKTVKSGLLCAWGGSAKALFLIETYNHPRNPENRSPGLQNDCPGLKTDPQALKISAWVWKITIQPWLILLQKCSNKNISSVVQKHEQPGLHLYRCRSELKEMARWRVLRTAHWIYFR